MWGVSVVLDAEHSAFQSYRAPADSGSAFVSPLPNQLADTIADNHEQLKSLSVSFGHHDFATLRAIARRLKASVVAAHTTTTNRNSDEHPPQLTVREGLVGHH